MNERTLDRMRRFLRLRRAGVPTERARNALDGKGTFSVEAEWDRVEELRSDLLGVPSEGEIRDDLPHDPWRPSRSLGKLPRR